MLFLTVRSAASTNAKEHLLSIQLLKARTDFGVEPKKSDWFGCSFFDFLFEAKAGGAGASPRIAFFGGTMARAN